MARIAISYRRADSAAICRAIFDRLVHKYGNESVFIDIDRIPIGENFHDYIGRTLQTTDVLLVVVGPKWHGPRSKAPSRIFDTDDPVRMELETAAAAGTVVVPVLVNDARMPAEGSLPESLRWFHALNAAHVDAGRDFDAHMTALCDAIERSVSKHPAHANGGVPNNIPHQLSSFVGRKSEIKHLQSLLKAKRLVTIVGPGGVGKTRLALHLAETVRSDYPGGVWFVPTSEAVNPDVAPAVANAIGLEIIGRDPLQTVLQHFGERRTLIVLDDSERYLQEIATFADEVMKISPFVQLLVTSRERLHVRGEQVCALTPFELPQPDMPLDQLRRSDAVRLILDRVQAHDDAFKLTEKNAADVARICERLDGIPLALEFVAARLHTLSAAQILQRLDEQFALLVGDSKDEDRHRTLRKTIEWSYTLLDEHERLLFARLAVFRASFSLDDAEAICSDELLRRIDVLDVLGALVEKSFVTKESDGDSPSFRMLHVIRSYAWERLGEIPDREALETRYFEHFAQLVEAFRGAEGERRAACTEALVSAHPDVIAALEWAVAQQRVRSVDLALALIYFWILRGFYGEGARILEEIARSGIADERGRALLLIRAASMRNAHGEHDAALADAQEGASICEQSPDQTGLADALVALASVHTNAGSYRDAVPLLMRARTIFEEASNEAGIANCLITLSLCDTALGEYQSARTNAEQAVAICERTRNERLLTWSHGMLGNAAHQSGDLATARTEYHFALDLARSMKFYFGVTVALSHLAEVELLDGNGVEAERCIDESLALVREHNLSLQLPDVLEAAARLLSQRQSDEDAAVLFGSVDAMRTRLQFPLLDSERKVRTVVIRGIVDRHTDKWFADRHAGGASLDPAAVLQLARRAISGKRAKTREGALHG